MYPVFDVAAVREAEAHLMPTLPAGTLMQRAAYGLAGVVADVLKQHVGHISGTTAVGLIGPGNNGSDTLLALSYLARRGVRVVAVDITGQRTPDHTDDAFTAAHGQWWSLNDAQSREVDIDVVLDGIAGLGDRKSTRLNSSH